MRLKCAQNNFTNTMAIMDKKSGQIITRIGLDIKHGMMGAPMDYLEEIVTIMMMEVEAYYGSPASTDEFDFVLNQFKRYLGLKP